MSVMTTLAIGIGIYIGKIFGEQQGVSKGYDYGYEDGFEEGMKEQIKEVDFPTTLDGKFFSTEAAIRSISKLGGDE